MTHWKNQFLLLLLLTGIGKIAQAIIMGLINKQLINPQQIFANDNNIEHMNNLKLNYGPFKVIIH